MTTPLVRLFHCHPCHHRHQPLSFNGLRVTQLRLPSSPAALPLAKVGGGDEPGDVWVTHGPALLSPHKHRKHRDFWHQRPAVTMVTHKPLLSRRACR
jgi:hypothetical protein